MPELELVSTEDLVGELFRRCDCGVITLCQGMTDDCDKILEFAQGNHLMVIGLLEKLKLNFLNHANSDDKYEEADDT